MPINNQEAAPVVALVDLRNLLDLLTTAQAADFWKFAAAQAKLLTHSRREHLDICLAIQECDREGQKARPASALPPVARRLSGPDIQKAVLRLKHRLVTTTAGAAFAKNQFCRWIQTVSKLELLAVLDAVSCPCDSNGTLTGAVPLLSGADAEAAILPLVAHFDPAELARVCGALVLSGRSNGGHWDCLAEVYSSLLSRSASQEIVEAEIAAPVPGSTEYLTSNGSPTESKGTAANVNGDVASINVFNAAPGIGNLIDDALASDTAPLNSSQAALVSAREIAQRCRKVVHATDPDFAGHIEIQRVASELDLSQCGGTLTPEQSAMLRGASALITLVTVGKALTDAEVEALDYLVQGTFGRPVSIAATRSRLTLADASGIEAVKNDFQTPSESSGASLSSTPAAPLAARSDALDNSINTSISSRADASTSVEAPAPQPYEDTTDQAVCERPLALTGFCAYANDYDQRFWIAGHGHVAPAPWKAATFIDVLADAVKDNWDRHRPDLAYLCARGMTALGRAAPIQLQDLAAADALLEAPLSLVAGTDPERAGRLREVSESAQGAAIVGFGLSLALEAMRPTLPMKLTVDDVDHLVALAGYKDPAMTSLISWMLKAWQAGMSPLQQLRERVNAEPPEDMEALRALLCQAEATFRDTLATYWSAAGGRLQHTHCRRAWSDFIKKEVVDLRREFGRLSAQPRLNPSGSHGQIRASLARMANAYRDIMTRAAVRFQDRTAADAAVEAIANALLRVGEVLQRMSLQQQRTRIAFDSCPVDEARRVLRESSSDATDQICARVFQSTLLERCELNPLRLPVSTLLAAPDLVKYVPLAQLATLDQDTSVQTISVAEILDPRAASALFLSMGADVEKSPSDEVIRRVREHAIQSDRLDILSALAPTQVLGTHERTLLNQEALNVVERLYGQVHKLEKLWSVCEELMVEHAPALRDAAVEARRLVERSDQANTLLDGRLIEHWMQETIVLADATVRDAINARIALAYERSPEVANPLKQLFAQGKYRDAVAMLHHQAPLGSPHLGASTRLTIWRDVALERFPFPAQALTGELRGEVDAQHALVEAWLDAPTSTVRDTLHRLVYAVVSGEAYRPPTEFQRRGIVPLGELRDFRERKTLIDCATLRDYFHAAGRNPSFLPQLAVLSKIVIVSLPSAASASVNALDECARAISLEQDNALVVFLEPGLPKARRDELSRGLRARALLGAFVDDVDLCRICLAVRESDDPAFIAFLEVLLEQQDLERVSPFSTQDGQHVRVETFVGRTREAEALALTGKYSRVFSGRKLGKSALLKYVAKRYDRQSLPSGQRLHVLFIAIAGGDSEQYVVDCIIDQMSRRFGLAEQEVDGEPKDRRQRARLSAYMHQFLVSNPMDSVLLIFDEADMFVEDQLANYDAARETSLSFCLLKELPAEVDRNEVPRIRTIFSGYRVTNTRDGVWANAGDVLVLHPLTEDEAVGFVTGTLARIGVDIGDHGSYIARRCGRQPAVLIRFGEVLIKHLARAGFTLGRETLRVTAAIVTAALTDQVVADEIRTVVANNFQGNRVGYAIFGATLLGLKDLAPGHALTDGPTQVLEKLKEIDSDLAWLTRIDASPTAVIERHLQEFIDRELLMVSETPRFGMREYRLKFPHFLPVLTQADTSLDVRQRIRSLKDKTPSRLGRCALSESMLEKARYCYRESAPADCKLVVVAGHWTEALLDPKCGLVNRLGCTNRERVEVGGAFEDEVDAWVDAGVRVFLDPPTTGWQSVLTVEAPRPLVVVGSIGWLRLALDYQMQGGPVPIQIISQGRLSEDTMRWWLEGARALHFESPATANDFVRLTGGIPLFAAAFDRALHGLPSDSPDAQAIEQAFESLRSEGMDRVAQLIVNPTSPEALTPRECELLIMAVKVSKELEGAEFDLEGEFAEYWEYCGEGADAPPMSLPEDRLALLVLIACGLISVLDEGASVIGARLGRAHIDPEGPVARLVAAMEHACEA